ncbi:MAG: hydrogenase formation protein HypD [gamma proteobacterium symbiont of Ctena orbiculata]|uniref:Hydrogenase maturation factor n=1 Tax=Candidatus Thiodiazotropha taylori TaxID=2792791 RepID=A0A944MF02_9GAMM|nr:hydrogenase formation protein HypD [Candidatus Thiodiazotropha taylori]PUB88650.1 MAG: hydrogenase formation protein HypD [gamma proteobacterium symbiont of Ctena orbiculata]MBT3027362.1 hydrogenase formation protein HypD [Candidatus Thiodiazotropha taylori]MBT3035175.1 hydrogenase formation protein HypD [Candidatus Thiodiazotropha taylori]MBV2138489.1 hydrogenase formation protein HypD [Candidatus Thiodiazotropha taylori]
MTISAKSWLQQINSLPLQETIKIMNVCGGHERSITQAGLRGALPPQIELIPGPGCPVCVCPEEDVYQAMQLALREPITLVAFGDMLRVPVNVGKGEPRSLDQAHAAGGDIRPIASPVEALQIAKACPEREVVFFAAGFETTTAPVASLLVEGIPDNLSILLSGRLTWPAVAMLLSGDTPGFNALVAPGHVATVMGPEEWSFVVERHRLPAAVAGFTPESLLAATYSVIRQYLDDRRFLDNCYPELVRPGGNPSAKAQLETAMDVVDANWRGIGVIPDSGFALGSDYARWDARQRFPDYDSPERRRSGEMPPGCDCAAVVLGKKYPNQCRLYGEACTPRTPIGPCMVSDEGACRIWWSGGIRVRKQS